MKTTQCASVVDCLPRLFYHTIGGVLSLWRLFRWHYASVFLCQRFSDSNYRRFSVALDYESVASSSWPSPRLKFCVKVFDEPWIRSLFS